MQISQRSKYYFSIGTPFYFNFIFTPLNFSKNTHPQSFAPYLHQNSNFLPSYLNFQTMASNLCITLTQSSPFSSKLYSSKNLLQKSHRISITPLTPFLKFQDSAPSQASTRGFTTICFSSPRNGPDYKVSIVNFKLAIRVS